MRIFHQWPLVLQIASVMLVSELLFSWAGNLICILSSLLANRFA